MKFPELFTPGRIGNIEIPNRVIKSSQSTATGNQDGTVSLRTVNHYKRLGEGGIGLVMVEYSHVDDDASKAIHNQLGNSRREHVPGLGWLADEVHATGARVGLQLAHGGRQKFLGTAPIKSASTSSWTDVEKQYGVVPSPMTVAEIDAVVEAFGEAAHRAWCARFDLVEVHAGHGYLITNFLSPHTNDRTDHYGGSFLNRARLLLRIVESIRGRVPRDFPLTIRLSVSDYEPDGIPIEETLQLVELLEEVGVDAIHCSGGHHATMEKEVSPWYQPRQPHRWGWEKIKERVSIPVIASGSIVSPEGANEILASGSADFVSLGRAFLADPDWANKAREGRELEITPCIRCNDGCLHRGLNKGRSAGCSVNPSVTEEGRFPLTITKKKKSVAIVGGGPAGLHSASLLHDRGHSVTIFEPRELGGQLNLARGFDIKQDLYALNEHLVHEVSRRDIRVLPRKATVKEIQQGKFDTVVLATGARSREADFPISHPVTVHASDIDHSNIPRGSVVVIGGGFLGCETALRISESTQATVTIVEEGPLLLSGEEVFTDIERLPLYLAEAEIDIQLGTRVTAVSEAGVHVDREGDYSLIPADTVVLALGREHGFTDLEYALRQEEVDTRVIGSAQRPGRVFDAMHSAFFTARLI